jgi:uncharacterized RDD family membrane protein YckC
LNTLTVDTPFNITLDFELAPFHTRLFAWIFDFVVQCLYVYFVLRFLGSTLEHAVGYEADNFNLLIPFIVFTPVLFYHLLNEVFLGGQSIGKKVFNLRVISLDGNPPTLSQYLIRWFLRTVDMSLTSYIGGILCVALTKHAQRIGDKAAGTTVVTQKLPYNVSDTIFKHINADVYKVSYPSVMRLSDRDINTINTILLQHNKNNMSQYLESVAQKIIGVLDITTNQDSKSFLETLMEDYNYLSQNK